jgi:hypothetical protein
LTGKASQDSWKGCSIKIEEICLCNKPLRKL